MSCTFRAYEHIVAECYAAAVEERAAEVDKHAFAHLGEFSERSVERREHAHGGVYSCPQICASNERISSGVW